MSIGPINYFGKDRVFVDRESCIQAFRENIQKSGTQEYNVLFYHGIAGIGKSKLQTELQRILVEEYPEITWASIDLNVKTYRDIGTFLIILRNKIQEKYSAKFQLFNAVHAIYWKKLHPEIPLQKQNYPLIKKGEILDKIIDVLENSGKLSLAWEILNSSSESFRKWCHLHHLDISKLESLEPNKIEELLPGIFASDFFEHFGENSKFYIFIDTYEALWDGLRDKGSFHKKDEWIRDNLILNMPGVSWVICGREKLRWVEECDSEWEMYLEQHSVDELPEYYCQEFLENCGIEDKDIRDIIIKASEGVPYNLALSVDLYEKIRRNRQPVSEDFRKTPPEIFNKFVKYLDSNEIRALEVLSALNFWNRDLFEILMKKFDSGYPAGAFSELIKFSFIEKSADGKYFIHKLMRKSLEEYQDPVDRKNIHKFTFEQYNNRLKDINIKAITLEHEKALIEAFYHAKKAFEAEELFEWFTSASDLFNRAAFWQLITPMFEEMLQILEAKLEPENPYVVTTLNDLALLYHQMGDYKKALPLFQRALEIRERVLGPQHPDVATTLNDLALLYHQMGDYKKALPLFQRALEIRERVLGPQHPDVATTLNNLAGLYRQMGDYDKVLPLFQRALDIRERVLGLQHPDVAATLHNLAEFYRQMGDYDKALPLFQRALDIREKALGPEHPSVATNLDNLAVLHRKIGDYKIALSFFQRALDIRERVLGPQHPDVAATLHNLAEFYRQMGDYDKALPLFQRALGIREKVLGSQHQDVLKTRSGLEELYQHMGGHEKRISDIKITPHGSYAVSASDDGTLKVWDLKTGSEVHTLIGHSTRVNMVSITPDGNYAVSASDDGTLKVWDIRTCKEIETLETYKGEVVSELKVLDSEEKVASLETMTRKLIGEYEFLKARDILKEIINLVPKYESQVQEEFGFLYDFSASIEEDEKRWLENKLLIKYQTNIWKILSKKNIFSLEKEEQNVELEKEENLEESEIQEVEDSSGIKKHTETKSIKESKNPEESGEVLEKAVLELFRLLFNIAESDGIILKKLRQQKRGRQGGCDIIVEYENWFINENEEENDKGKAYFNAKNFNLIIKKNELVKCHVECKNINTDLKLSDIAHKLIATSYCFPEIDHWIVICPNAKPSNELNEIIPKLEEMFPFKIHIWSLDAYARDFFGLISKKFHSNIYDELYKLKDSEVHPREWSDQKTQEVYEQLKMELKPLNHLPKQWDSYVKNPRFLKINDEIYEELEALYEHYVDLEYMDEQKNRTRVLLEKHVREWLNDTEKPLMFLLGEYGDGKSLFTYVLSRKLIQDLNEDPTEGWIPIRFSLKDYYSSRDFREFLENRLISFGVNLENWYKLKNHYEKKNEQKRILIILDGFDEISESLDSEKIFESKKVLINLCNEFSGLKIIITSRTNFFENQQDLEKLMKNLPNCCICHLSPIDRDNVVNNLRKYLEKYVKTLDPEESLEHFNRLHDPIGLATKPLYLQMIKEVFEELQENDLKNGISEVKLYEGYVKRSLKIKKHLLINSREKSLSDVDEICFRLTKILENISLKFLEPEKKYISLIEDFPNNEDQNFAKFLWEISGSKEEREDATLKVGVRSLLIRVNTNECSKKWLVDFCHRSMREYFIAKGICNVLKQDSKETKQDPQKTKELISRAYLNNEILHFSAEIMKRDDPERYEENLLKIIDESRKTKLNVGNYATLLYRLKGELPGTNWSNLILDRSNFFRANLSGKDFKSTTLREANLYNVNFEYSDFQKSDLTRARLAETKPVIAISVHSRDKILAAYGDNTMAEWNISHISKPKYNVIGKNKNGNIKSMSSFDIYDLLAITDEEVIFFDIDSKGKLTEKSRFKIKKEYKQILPKKDTFLLISENENKDNEILILDQQPKIVHSKLIRGSSICENIGQDAYIISKDKNSLDIVSTNSTKKTVTLKVSEATSLSIFCYENNKNYLLACGQSNGNISVWKGDLSKDEFFCKLVFESPVHEGIISSLTFLDEKRIVTGGLDRKICILKFDPASENTPVTKEAELYLTIRCKGMKIKDMVESKEREFLEELIKRAENKQS